MSVFGYGFIHEYHPYAEYHVFGAYATKYLVKIEKREKTFSIFSLVFDFMNL
jgi:hypothetical protein